jgi:glycosyltransferase involved in cell wall biosynthesis
LFEGAGIPLLDAFYEGLPATCSDIPPFREYAADAALFFDPDSVDSIAAALQRMSADSDLRSHLRRRGETRKRLFTWQRTAEMYRAVYRLVGQVPLTEHDKILLRSALDTTSADTACPTKYPQTTLAASN